jgi:hypothetical protein
MRWFAPLGSPVRALISTKKIVARLRFQNVASDNVWGRELAKQLGIISESVDEEVWYHIGDVAFSP